MPRKWTKAQREAQSLKMKAHWEKKKLAKLPHVKKVVEQPHWLERVKSALGLS